MPSPPPLLAVLEGPRARLRPFRASDAAAFAALNADPEVMRHFAAPLSRAESDAFLARILANPAETGFMAVEERATGAFAGLCGLARVPWPPLAGEVEIGWRLAPAFQGRGLATEAARLALAHALGPLGIARVVAFTVPANERSWRLMERVGMTRVGAFEHPRLPEGHPLRPHVLYEVRRPAAGRTG